LNTKTVAIITIFTALTIVLNLSSLRIPFPLANYLVYNLWEIPIVAAFLLFGLTTGIIIAAFNTAVLFVVFPGMLITGPLYNLAAVLSMLLGMIIVKIFVRSNPHNHGETFLGTFSTISGVTFRVGIMTLVNWTFLRFPPPVGFGMPEQAILVALPLIAIFNATLALYTIFSGHLIAKAVKLGTKTV
jgi:riboflavin transporter FmnP